MSAILLAPHADDETLFAFYTLLRDQAHVLVVLDDGGEEREEELRAAMKIAGRDWGWLGHSGRNPDWPMIRDDIARVTAPFDTVIAPAFEGGGHEDHNEVAIIAAGLGKPVTSYYTYERGCGRTARGHTILPSAAQRVLKRRAMDCYRSQISDPQTRPWFEAGWQVEYVEFEQ